MSAVSAAMLLLLAAGIVLRFHSAGQLDARFWNFFAWATTWSFLARVCSAPWHRRRWPPSSHWPWGWCWLGRLARPRLLRWPSVAVIEFLRGTPTLLLIYVCFLVLPRSASSSAPTGC
jgi:ABC-type amino acid transport system permease subunit